MRQIVLDTETTGIEIKKGNRVIEIGCIEIISRTIGDRQFHCYLNPDRESEPGALQVHGLSTQFLADKPRFEDIADSFLDFIQGSELIIHNAPFDCGFLNHELSLIGLPSIEESCDGVLDSLKLARSLHPSKRNSLDALCQRYNVDNSGRIQHGAILDCQLLAEVYLCMTRGQNSLPIFSATHADQDLSNPTPTTASAAPVLLKENTCIPVLAATPTECEAHNSYLAQLENAIWT